MRGVLGNQHPYRDQPGPLAGLEARDFSGPAPHYRKSFLSSVVQAIWKPAPPGLFPSHQFLHQAFESRAMNPRRDYLEILVEHVSPGSAS